MSDFVLKVTDLGLMPYEAALVAQEQALTRVVAGVTGEIFTVEHPSVITLGRHADLKHVLHPESELTEAGISLVRTERGGEVTCHNPGQLVIYPILPLSRMGLSVRSYVRLLEQSIINTLREVGLAATRDPNYPGVWVGADKICAVGIRIKQRVSMHGIALNIDNDLSIFNRVVPCGIQGRGVTSVSNLGVCASFLQLREIYLLNLTKLVGVSL